MDDHKIEEKISNLIAAQFPSFYREEGPVFVQFVKAYYEWMEEEGNTLYKARSILKNTDIDDTLEKFLEYFQKKYLYGIPFDVIINKRFLLKHVLDAYRSKGSFQCFKLLFRLIYNQDVDIYLPGLDMLRVSDGTWVEPRYIEVTNIDNLQDYVGKTIYGLSSGMTAVVESYITEPFNGNVLATLYLSNLNPKGGDFTIGEKVIDNADRNATNLFEVVQMAPVVLGSLDYVEIINGGTDFSIGDALKIVHRDIDTNEIVSFGTEGIVRVSNTVAGRGAISFDIESPGSGIRADAQIMIFNDLTDVTGSGAGFDLSTISDAAIVSFNTDLLADYADIQIGALAYGMPGNPSGNATSTMANTLTFTTGLFGSVSGIDSIVTGNNYTQPVDVFVRSTMLSDPLAGSITYTSASANVVGVGTEFDRFFNANDVIYLVANTSDANNTTEYSIIRSISNNTHLVLYGKPTHNSGTAEFRLAADIIQSQYATYEPESAQEDQSLSGRNVVIAGLPVTGNGSISNTSIVRSGKGYLDGENVTLYLYGAITDPTIVTAGTGYANGEQLVFSGSTPTKDAVGTILTNANGSIINTDISYYGAGYEYAPTIIIRTANGTGAYLTTSIQEFNSIFEVTGRVRKAGLGKGKGYYSTTRGHLNSDKYIQDSNFYQDFSYQIRAAQALNTYRDILYNTFHIAGTAMFGEFNLRDTVSSTMNVVSDSTSGFVPLGYLIPLYWGTDELLYGTAPALYGDYSFSWGLEEITYG